MGIAFRRFATTRLICIHPLSRTVFLYRILKIKPIEARQVLDGGENNGTTLVKEANRWQRLLNSGGRSVEV